jgi:hypothetical protein
VTEFPDQKVQHYFEPQLIKGSLERMFFLLTLSIFTISVSANKATPFIKPARLEMKIPEKGFVPLDEQDFDSACDTIVSDPWQRSSLKTFDLFVHIKGPAGSGRYWTITVGAADKRAMNPNRGFCFTTTTVGWRTLQQYKRSPLPWLEDLDNDKKPELIIWDSFPVSEQASLAQYGLVAWVYQVDPQGRFVIDWKLSCLMAQEIAAAYRKPLQQGSPLLQELRNKIAEELETFCKETSSAETEHSR